MVRFVFTPCLLFKCAAGLNLKAGSADCLMPRLIGLRLHGPHIKDVRGRGLMIGIGLDMPHKPLRHNLVYGQHCFTGCAGTDILCLLPPLCFAKDMADDFIERLKKAFGII